MPSIQNGRSGRSDISAPLQDLVSNPTTTTRSAANPTTPTTTATATTATTTPSAPLSVNNTTTASATTTNSINATTTNTVDAAVAAANNRTTAPSPAPSHPPLHLSNNPNTNPTLFLRTHGSLRDRYGLATALHATAVECTRRLITRRRTSLLYRGDGHAHIPSHHSSNDPGRDHIPISRSELEDLEADLDSWMEAFTEQRAPEEVWRVIREETAIQEVGAGVTMVAARV